MSNGINSKGKESSFGALAKIYMQMRKIGLYEERISPYHWSSRRCSSILPGDSVHGNEFKLDGDSDDSSYGHYSLQHVSCRHAIVQQKQKESDHICECAGCGSICFVSVCFADD